MGQSSNINQRVMDQFQSAFRGELIQPGDQKYETARKVYNAMIDKQPRLIARCADTADVIAAVNFGRENNLTIAVRGGGHNAGGLGVWDDALVIDLSPIKYVHVDPEAKTARVGGGCTWGDVDHATHAFGLAVPTGIISTTGVGGLTLGGGLGHLTRKCALTIDNLLAADVVLADGSFVTASEFRNDDLFWAIRGGGGNFGVVTSFLFKSHDVHTDCAGPMLWELERAPQIMRWYREFITKAPEDLNGFFLFLTVPPAPPFPESLQLKKMCGIVWCYAGPLDIAEQVYRPIRDSLKPTLDLVGPLPHPVLNRMFDALYVPGLQWYWKADFVNSLSDKAIAVHMEHAPQMPTMFCTMHLYPINGAASRVGATATPWAYRDATWAQVIVGVDPDPASKDVLAKWAREYWEDLHPYSAGGAYVNFMMEEGEDRIRATYGENYDRLAAIKARYDPQNLFHVNQNIKPKAMTQAQEQLAS